MKKFLIGPITGIMEKRKNLIAQQFKDAETVQNQAQEMKTQYETALSGAKEESVQIIADARSDAKALSERTLKEANEELHTTILMVTHDAYAASFANRILIFKDGSIIRELLKQDADRRTFYETIAQEVAKLDTER